MPELNVRKPNNLNEKLWAINKSPLPQSTSCFIRQKTSNCAIILIVAQIFKSYINGYNHPNHNFYVAPAIFIEI
jgi:hypothetical protein